MTAAPAPSPPTPVEAPEGTFLRADLADVNADYSWKPRCEELQAEVARLTAERSKEIERGRREDPTQQTKYIRRLVKHARLFYGMFVVSWLFLLVLRKIVFKAFRKGW